MEHDVHLTGCLARGDSCERSAGGEGGGGDSAAGGRPWSEAEVSTRR